MSHEPSLRETLEATEHQLQLARAELERRRALDTPRPSAWGLASVARLTLLVLVLAGLLGLGLGLYLFFWPEAAAELTAWVLQKLCDLLLGRRC